ncbi:MAG: glycosyltransferase family 2 protein [Parvularculaceae bacterium]|nr:glycosyltransferase family 2 protein [Parvularculaceae bacterium]
MTTLIALVAFIPASIVFALAAFYALEVALAFLGPGRMRVGGGGSLAILIPAHDEEKVLAATLRSVKATMRPEDRIVVIADNCTDATAAVARAEGAETIERTDPARRGKGFALQFGIDHLRADPPFGVVVVDADCTLHADAFSAIAQALAATGRPAQMLYVMHAPPDAPPQRKIAAFAWILLNKVRMRGLMRLADCARLTGAGMALPWSIAERVDLASSEIVEDIALSARLASEGAAPLLVEEALIESVFPLGDAGAMTQRARWENGSLRLALGAPRLLFRGLLKGDGRLAATALDLAVPPLGLFGALIIASIIVSAAASAFGVALPLRLSLAAFCLLAGATAIAWIAFGREALPPRDLVGAGAYLKDKFSVYFGRGRASAAVWTRTERDAPSDTPPS